MSQDTAIGMNETRTYEITIPGEDAHTFVGTQAEMWEHVTARMTAAGATTTPGVKEITEPAPAPEPTAEQQPEPTEEERFAEGVARVEEDRAVLEAWGLSPGQRFHDRGGPVGNGKVRRSQREHDAKDNVHDAVDKFCTAIEAEERQDYVVPSTTLVMHSNGTIAGKDGATWRIEADALTQLASRIGIEHPSYLPGIWPDLRAVNWNQHIATAIGHERSTCPASHPVRTRLSDKVAGSNALCRVRKDMDGEPTIWAALSERYAVYDVDQIARAMERAMQRFPDAKCEIEYDGRNMKLDVIFHSDIVPEHYRAGEVFKTGVRVRSSDGGTGSINVGHAAWSSLCTNMMIVDVGEFCVARLRHLGDSDKLAERFAQAIRDANMQQAHFLKKWGYACEEDLAAIDGDGVKPVHLRLLDEMPERPLSETELLTGIFQGIAKSGNVSITRNDLPGLLAAHTKDQSGAVDVAPVTRASVINAITRHAHETVGRTNPIRQMELEREAGALLVSARGRGNPAPLPFWPPPVPAAS